MPKAKARIARRSPCRKRIPSSLPLSAEAKELLRLTYECDRLHAAACAMPSHGAIEPDLMPRAKQSAFARWRGAMERLGDRSEAIAEKLLRHPRKRDVAALLIAAREAPKYRPAIAAAAFSALCATAA